MTPPSRSTIAALVGFLAVSYGASALGSLFTFRSLRVWYRLLARPRWTPPDAVFGPVWTVLYGLMALSAWLVWRQRDRAGDATRLALGAWAFQLVLNVAWSVVFFGRRQVGAGVWVIAALWSSILATILLARRVSPLGAGLLLPYLAWTGFASALNARIWQLNRRRPWVAALAR